MNLYLKRSLALSCLSAGFFLVQGVAAQESVIEEVTVTATKIERNQQDVPIALTAFTGDMMQESNIKDMRDLASITPSLISSQSQNSTTSSFAVRGIGTSGQNFGLEPSVGMYIDGVYRSRQSSFINNLADLEAVEVLRGPQGTLFGKNTASGALNVRTVRPDFDSKNAYIDLNVGELGLVNLSGATNINVSDNFALRFTGFYGMRDGYVDDIVSGRSDVLNDRDRFGGRLQAYWQPNDRFDMRIIADYAEIDEVCCAAVTNRNNFLAFDGMTPGSDSALAFGLGLPVIPESDFENNRVAFSTLPRSTNEDSGLSVEFNYDFENVTLTSVSAFRSFETTDFIDADFNAGDILTDLNVADQSSFSQELRLTGEIGDRGSWTVGAYYFQQDLDNVSTLDIGVDADPFLSGGEPLASLRAGIDGLSIATMGAYPLTAAAFPAGGFATDDMRQDHESYAVFGQADFPIGDDFVLTAGLRFTSEEKDMDGTFTNTMVGPPPDLAPTGAIITTLTGIGIWSVDPMLPGAIDPTDPANVPGILAAFGPTYVPGWGFYLFAPLAPQAPLTATIDDDQVTGALKLSWFVNDSAMLYAAYATGYKSGGTNTDRIDPVFSQTFDAETSEMIEVGLKMDFERARLNVAFHDTQFEDLQTNAFSGTGFNLQNAGDADTHGAEVDFTWQPVDSFNLQANYAYNVADFENFANGTCWVATPFQIGTPDPGQGNPLLPVCDRSGGRVPANPESRFFVAGTKDFQIGDNTTLYVRAEVNHMSDTMTDGNNDPLKLRDDFTFVNARIGIYFDNINSELAIWGRNLTDEFFYETLFDVPIQDGKLNAYPHEPLTWGVQYRMNFD